MNRTICVLDACCIIHLLLIDEQDRLWNRLRQTMNYRVSDVVIREVQGNYRSIKELSENEGEVQQKINHLWGHCIQAVEVAKSYNPDLVQEVSDHLAYHKKNGEFFSSVISYHLAGKEKTKIFFHTDDIAARDCFSPFFQSHQIGAIEDTVDLIILMHRQDPSLIKRDALRFINNLLTHYRQQVVHLLGRLRHLQSEINTSIRFRKDRTLKKHLESLIEKLDGFNLSGITAHHDALVGNSQLSKIFKAFPAIFDIASEDASSDYFTKILHRQQQIENDDLILLRCKLAPNSDD